MSDIDFDFSPPDFDDFETDSSYASRSSIFADDDDEQNEDLLTQLRDEYQSLQNRIQESRLQISQNQAEVERMEAEYNQASIQLRRVQDEFDTRPRQDIRVAYDTFIKISSRRMAIQSQMQKLQENIAQLERYASLIQQVLENFDERLLAGSTTAKNTNASVTTLSASGEMIIRIVQAQEDERQVLAKNLHDGPAQSLSNFILQAEVCQRLFDRNPDRAAAELDNLKSAASDSFQKVRDFIFDLRPMMLEDLGLIPTLRRYAENYSQKHNIKVEFTPTGEERRLARHTEVMMFRSIQQLLTVTREYLGATEIKIQVDISAERVRGIVNANGKGFDVDTDLNPEYGHSNVQVLNTLKDRIELIGGELDIFSDLKNGGSRFDVILPIFEETLVE
ncbi:MAG: hypothetical protein CUN55_11930 [Phototrophicales bacterium]|nr:MAG: hypothetical protein CUN55_11930 [Phototrophicales bacterium]